MNDETQVVPVDGATEAPEASTQTTEAPVVSPETQAPPTLSRDEVERLLNEREARLRAEFEQQARRNQSKTDKAYAEALRKAKVIEESAGDLGLDADAILVAKQKLVDREFAAAFSEAQPSEVQNAAPPTPPSAFVTRDELLTYVQAQGLDASAVDLAKYEGARRGDTQVEQEFLDDIALARARQIEQRKLKKQQQAQAQKTAEVKQEFGSVASPTAGAPSAGYDPVAELDKMNAEDPPNNPKDLQAWLQRREKFKKEAAAKLNWR